MKESKLREIIKEEVEKQLLNEINQRDQLVKKIQRLQRKYGEENTLSAVLEDFSVGRIRTAIAQARKTLQREKQQKQSNRFQR